MTTTNQLKKFLEDGEIMTVPLYVSKNNCTPPTARKILQKWNIVNIQSNIQIYIQDSAICKWFTGNVKGGVITTIKRYAEDEGITPESARLRLLKWGEVEIGNKRYLYIKKDLKEDK